MTAAALSARPNSARENELLISKFQPKKLMNSVDYKTGAMIRRLHSFTKD